MAKRDYYEVLGVSRTASEPEIKAAYRKLAKRFHPDANPGDKSADHAFKEIGEAYEALKDPQKRAAYDRFGHAAFDGSGRGPSGFGPEFSSSMSDIFEDLFGEFMGGGGRRGGRRGSSGMARGSDLRYNMEISLTEAYTGKPAQIRVPTSVSCESCSGQGSKAGSKPKTCPTCAGQGSIRSASGFFTVERTCVACQGRGQVISDPCPECNGQRLRPEARHVLIDGRSISEITRMSVVQAREWFGTIDVVGHWHLPLPGSVESVELRAQDPGGPYSGPMLRLLTGSYPSAPGEAALTDEVAADLRVGVGGVLALDGRTWTVVGLVENPGDLRAEFVLVAPAQPESPESVTVLTAAEPAPGVPWSYRAPSA